MASNPEIKATYPPCPIKPLYNDSGGGLLLFLRMTLNNNCYINFTYTHKTTSFYSCRNKGPMGQHRKLKG